MGGGGGGTGTPPTPVCGVGGGLGGRGIPPGVEMVDNSLVGVFRASAVKHNTLIITCTLQTIMDTFGETTLPCIMHDQHHELNWKTVKARHRILMCCQVYKVLENLDCLGTEDFFKFNSTVTRASPTSLCLANARVNVYRYSFFVNSPYLWNSLPSFVHCSSSYYSFKRKLYNFF